MKFVLLFVFTLSLYASMQPTQVQKEKYLYPLGKKILQKECGELTKSHFDSFLALRNYIHTHCTLEERRYEDALVWYVWDKKNMHEASKKSVKFAYTKKDKCPVCGMFVYKYPKWVTMAVDAKGKRVYFDGVKDMMKYYFTHKDAVLQLYAQDYYSKKIIELHHAWLVLGSDLYGPMGEELIPFADKKEAQSFLFDHHGKKIVQLDQLDLAGIEALDE